MIDGDHRSEFQRDYDRCLFSTPVRRLQDKAQVFPLEPNDSVRTRLTHSLEVSNLSRAIAERVGEKLIEKGYIEENQRTDIVFMASTCGLIHDLGNPPFGHSGEDAMRDWFKSKIKEEGGRKFIQDKKKKKDFLNFEGNAQTLRLVSKLQMLGDFSGLNLTLGTLAGSRKYLSESTEVKKLSGQQYKKLGYFQSEKELLEQVEKETGTTRFRHPITYLVEAADDIVYSIIDLEDGIKKRVLTWADVRTELYDLIPEVIKKAERNIFERAIRQDFTPKRKIESLESEGREKFGKDNVEDINSHVHQNSEFIELSGQSLSEARMSILRTALMGEHIDAVVGEFFKNYDAIMNGNYESELVANKHRGEVIKRCKQIAFSRIFGQSDILKLEIMGRNIIHDLMDHCWEGIKNFPYEGSDLGKENRKNHPFGYKIYSLLSSNYKTIFEYRFNRCSQEDSNYVKLQLLADYICGMTDSFARQLHKEVKNG
ncbi:MAG: dGTP triphosphohydrolase [Bacteroidota bacterium]